MGKGSGGGPISLNPPPPTEEEKALQRASTGLLEVGRGQIEAGSPLRGILTAIGQQAAVTGTATPAQLPSLQRQLNVLKQANSTNRANTLASLAQSKLAGTPFGQNILAGLDSQRGLQEAGLLDAATTNAMNLGLQGIGQSGQVGSNVAGIGLQGLTGGVNAQANRFGSALQAQSAQSAMNAQISQANSQALGSGLGSLAGLGAAGLIAFSNPKLKTDIKPAKDEAALAAVRKLPISTWRYKGDSQIRLGGMTTDMPDDVIVGDLKTRMAYDPISYLGMLTGAVRALDKQVTAKRKTKRRRV